MQAAPALIWREEASAVGTVSSDWVPVGASQWKPENPWGNKFFRGQGTLQSCNYRIGSCPNIFATFIDFHIFPDGKVFAKPSASPAASNVKSNSSSGGAGSFALMMTLEAKLWVCLKHEQSQNLSNLANFCWKGLWGDEDRANWTNQEGHAKFTIHWIFLTWSRLLWDKTHYHNLGKYASF